MKLLYTLILVGIGFLIGRNLPVESTKHDVVQMENE
jgi:hypothetical protein